MDSVAIVGVGLIGGSFALAIRKAGFNGRIFGVSSPATIARALEMGVIDEGLSLGEACSRADLVYLAGPIRIIVRQLPEIAAMLKPGALVTDAGSTKCRIVEAGQCIQPPSRFLGGHPMAGKETSGVAEAEAGLFVGKPYVFTPVSKCDLSTACVQEFRALVEAIGALPIVLTPEEHDRLVAFTSHVPQMVSTAYAMTLGQVEGSEQVAGRAAGDFTRLAASSYDIWRDILDTNGANIAAALDLLVENVQFLHTNLSSDLSATFYEAKVQSQKLRKKSL